MNRFNNFFLGAATLLFHAEEIELFFSNYRDNLNLKLESVLADCKCSSLKSLTRALGILYYKVTCPFWEMLLGGVQYVDQYLYVQQMLAKFRLWAQDSSLLMAKDDEGIFTDFPPKKDEIFEVLLSDAQTKSTLESLMISFIEVTERQLSDFLPGGKFGTEPDEDLRDKMRYSKLTNLLSENEFGDLDFGFFKRRSASLHYHSGIQMVKRNRTISAWLSSKSPGEQSRLLKLAREKGSSLRKKHRENEKAVVVKHKERLEMCNESKKAKAAAALKLKEQISISVREHGGPCRTAADVNRSMKGLKAKKAQNAVLKVKSII
jgi:aubergine-like protein